MSTKLAAAAGYVICGALAILIGGPLARDAIRNPWAFGFVVLFAAVIIGLWQFGEWLIDRPKAAARAARQAESEARWAELDAEGKRLDAELAQMKAERPAVLRADADERDQLAQSLIEGGLRVDHPFLQQLWDDAHHWRAKAAELEAEMRENA